MRLFFCTLLCFFGLLCTVLFCIGLFCTDMVFELCKSFRLIVKCLVIENYLQFSSLFTPLSNRKTVKVVKARSASNFENYFGLFRLPSGKKLYILIHFSRIELILSKKCQFEMYPEN